jgi:hypothetical protein
MKQPIVIVPPEPQRVDRLHLALQFAAGFVFGAVIAWWVAPAAMPCHHGSAVSPTVTTHHPSDSHA